MNIFSRTKSRVHRPLAARNASGGFTLLELTFVIGIFAIMATIVLINFKSFGAATALDNLAQGVALRVVGAQRAATSGVLTPGLLGADQASAPSYGVNLTSGSVANTADQEFTYFADINHSGYFDDSGSCPSTPTATNECLSVTSITTGDYISDLCYQYAPVGGALTTTCDPSGEAYLTFTRPNPDARMGDCPLTGCSPSAGHIDNADTTYIEVSSSGDASLKETIIVTALGEVRVETGAACAYDGLSCAP